MQFLPLGTRFGGKLGSALAIVNRIDNCRLTS
jgi:hypothetical protein